MRIIGLVGGSGTGKSTVASHLARAGVRHIDADSLGHEIMDRNDDVKRRVVERFGRAVLGKDGRIDRQVLGSIVFRDPKARAALGAIIHPAIIEACRREIEESRREGADLVVIDAALLLEVPLPFEPDMVIALRCSREERLRRLMAEGGASEEEIRARLESQENLEKSFYRADAVVDTDRPIEAVFKRIDALIARKLGNEG